MQHPTPTLSPAELRFGGSWKMIIPFALLPLLIVSASVGLFFMFGKLAQSELNAENYLAKLKKGTSHQRWQAAYGLAGFLARNDVGPNRDQFESELLGLLKEAPSGEKELRRYLLAALGQIGTAHSVAPISTIAEGDQDPEIRIFALWTLGRIGRKESAPLFRKAVASKDPGLRKTGAYGLGITGGSEDLPSLRHLLQDSERDVRWNSALALAQLGNDSGFKEILTLLDPSTLEASTPNLREPERNQILISALNATGRLQSDPLRQAARKLAQTATDPAVRETARRVMAIGDAN